MSTNVDHYFDNPYVINRHDVNVGHFVEGRLYDKDIDENGWQVQKWVARKKFDNWKSDVRGYEGWEHFRRPAKEMPPKVYHEVIIDGETEIVKSYEIRKLVWPMVPGLPYREHIVSKTRIPSIKHVGKDDEDEDEICGRMFTATMGKEISMLRSGKKMTQAELGNKISVDVTTIKNIEIGGLITFDPEDLMVKKLARVLGVSNIQYKE